MLTPRSDDMAKHFLLSFFVRAKKRGGPACNAGGFLGTSLPIQRSAFYIKEYWPRPWQLSMPNFHTGYLSSIGSVIKTHWNSQLANQRSLRFFKRVAKLCKCPACSKIFAVSCPLGDDANFVGNNKNSAGYYLARRTIKVFEPLSPLFQPLIR